MSTPVSASASALVMSLPFDRSIIAVILCASYGTRSWFAPLTKMLAPALAFEVHGSKDFLLCKSSDYGVVDVVVPTAFVVR